MVHHRGKYLEGVTRANLKPAFVTDGVLEAIIIVKIVVFTVTHLR